MANRKVFPGLGRRGVQKELVTYGHRLSRINLDYLRGVAADSHSTYARALNQELDFARSWGLPAPIAVRVDAEAARRGLLPKQYVSSLVRRAAMAVPRVTAPTPRSERAALTTAQLTPPNHAFVQGIIERECLSSLIAIDVVVQFCRTYGLSPSQLAALQAEAARLRLGVRDLVRMLLWREVSPRSAAWGERLRAAAGAGGLAL